MAERRQAIGSVGAAGASSTVVNFVGRAGIRCVPCADEALPQIAAWAVQHGATLERALRAVRAHPGEMPRSGIPFGDEILRHGWITGGARPRITLDGVLVLEALNRTEGGDRTAETERFVRQRGTIGPSSRVLDVGCSTGRLLRRLADLGPQQMVGLDLDLFALHVAALGWTGGRPPLWCCSSAAALPFPDEAFTHVLSFVTLNALPVRAALREFARVLEPGGQLLLTVEGYGYWLRQWRRARGARRLHLLRELAAGAALPDLDWQRLPVLRRASQHVVFSLAGLDRMLAEAGLHVDQREILRDEGGAPWLIGVAAHRRAAR